MTEDAKTRVAKVIERAILEVLLKHPGHDQKSHGGKGGGGKHPVGSRVRFRALGRTHEGEVQEVGRQHLVVRHATLRRFIKVPRNLPTLEPVAASVGELLLPLFKHPGHDQKSHGKGGGVGEPWKGGAAEIQHTHTGTRYRIKPVQFQPGGSIQHEVKVHESGRWKPFVTAREGGPGAKSADHWRSDRYVVVKPL